MNKTLFLRPVLAASLLIQSLAPAAHAARGHRAAPKPTPPPAALARLQTLAARVNPAFVQPPVVKTNLIPVSLDSVKGASPAVDAASADAKKTALPPVQAKLDAAGKAAAEAVKPGSSAEAAPGTLHKVWSGEGARAQDASADAVAVVPGAEAEKPASTLSPSPKRSTAGKVLRVLGLAALVPALGVAQAGTEAAGAALPGFQLPEWLTGAVTAVIPYAQGIGTLFATHYVNQGVRWGVTRLGQTFGWKENTIAIVRLVSTLTVLGGGAAWSLSLMRMPTDTLITTFGIGGVAMTMAAKDFIGNFLEGVKILVKQPFQMGDYLLVGGKLLRASDMSLQHIKFDAYTKSVNHRKHSKLAGVAITVFREHVPQMKFKSPKGLLGRTTQFVKLAVANVFALTREMPKPDLKKAGFWALVAGGLLYGLPQLKNILVGNWFQTIFPFLEGGAVFFAAHSVQKWVGGMITTWGLKRGWHPQKIVLWKLLAQGAVYAVGGPIALSMMGLTMTSLLTYVGASAVIIGWATADILGNVIKAFTVMGGKKIQIGDIVEFDTIQGKVVDLDWNYLIVEHTDKSHTLVPYSMTDDFSSMHQEDADPSAPKPTNKKKVTLGGVTGVLVEFSMNGAIIETASGEKVAVAMDVIKAQPFHKDDYTGAGKEAAAREAASK